MSGLVYPNQERIKKYWKPAVLILVALIWIAI